MEHNQFFKQMIDLNKAAFYNGFNTMEMFQTQTEKMMTTFLEKATWIPEEGKKMNGEWTKAYKKGFQDFKKAADDNFKKMENFFPFSQ